MKFIFLILFIVYGLLSTTAYSESHLSDRLAHANVYKITGMDPAKGSGTAFTIRYRNKLYTLTNAHICVPHEKIGTMLLSRTNVPNHRRVKVKILSVDSGSDLCLLTHIDETPGLSLASSWYHFQSVMTYGHPLGNSLTPAEGKLLKRENVTLAYPSTEKQCIGKKTNWRPIQRLPRPKLYQCMRTINSIYTSIMVYPGNSGSPVLSERGQVVGVVFASQNITHFGSIVPLRAIYQFLQNAAK